MSLEFVHVGAGHYQVKATDVNAMSLEFFRQEIFFNSFIMQQ
jgi:hypothetical protein